MTPDTLASLAAELLAGAGALLLGLVVAFVVGPDPASVDEDQDDTPPVYRQAAVWPLHPLWDVPTPAAPIWPVGRIAPRPTAALIGQPS